MKSNRFKHGTHWTVLIIPTYYGRVTNLKVPTWLLKMAAGATIAVLAVSMYLLVYNLELRSEAKHYEELKVTNRQQQEEIMRLKQEEEAIREKIRAVETLEKQVRELVGLTSREGTSLGNEGAGSMGSGIPLSGVSDVVDSLPQGSVREDNPGATGARGLDGDEWLEILRGIAIGFDELNPLLEQQVASLEKLQTDIIARQHYLAHLPTRWPVEGPVTSGFGYRQSPFDGGKEFHEGLDIAASSGTPVVAAGGGKVIFSGGLTGYGLTVIIDHGYGYQTQYSHLSSLLVERGQTVKKGEVIARVGSTGRSTGPHLHFMVSVNGKQVDPLGILP